MDTLAIGRIRNVTVSEVLACGEIGRIVIQECAESLRIAPNKAKSHHCLISDGFVNRDRYLKHPGYVYICEEVGRPVYKIGRSVCVPRRLKELSATKGPYELKMARIYETDAMCWAEKYLHDEFLPNFGFTQLNGEWWEGEHIPDVVDSAVVYPDENPPELSLKSIVGQVESDIALDNLRNRGIDVTDFWTPDEHFQLLVELDALMTALKTPEINRVIAIAC